MSILTDLKKTLNLIFLQSVSKATPLGSLKDKVVLITGAGKGIGKAAGEYLYSEGCKVALLSRDLTELNAAFPKETYNDTNALLLLCDVTKPDQVQQAVKIALEKFGKIDVLVNNVGVNIEKPLEQCASEDIDRIIDTNVKGALNMASAVIPCMKMAQNGTIINIGSKITHNTNVAPNKVLYATSKYAVEGMSFALNKELKNFGVRVLCLMPGTVNTFVSTKSGSYMSPTRVAQVIAMVIKFEDIDFEGLVFKSKGQDL